MCRHEPVHRLPAAPDRRAIATHPRADSPHRLSTSPARSASTSSAAIRPKKAISDFRDSFHLSAPTKQEILSNVNPPRLVHEKFRFDVSEFSKNLAYKQVELDTGALMTAPAEKLDDCFKATRASQWS